MIIDRRFLITGTTIILLVTVSFFTLSRAGSWLVVDNEPEHADAIVVLMGSVGDRMLQASELYKKGYAERVLMVNTYVPASEFLLERGVYLKTNAEQSKEIGVALGIPEESIDIVPGSARSTRDEAIALNLYFIENSSIRTIMIVTSSYHSRRSLAIFNRSTSYLDYPVRVIIIPSDYTEFDYRRWYADRQSAKRVVMEYTRLFYFWIWERWRL